MLHRLRSADGQAWDRMVEVFGPVVYQWCRRASVEPNDAADIAQEVFQAVSLHLSRFERTSREHTFRGWLWTITRNKIRDHFRAAKRRPLALGGTDANAQIQQLSDNLDEELSNDDDSQCLIAHRVLEMIRGDFNEKTWQAFWRMAVKGEPSADIAADLNMNQESVRQAKARVLRRFRQEVEGLL